MEKIIIGVVLDDGKYYVALQLIETQRLVMLSAEMAQEMAFTLMESADKVINGCEEGFLA